MIERQTNISKSYPYFRLCNGKKEDKVDDFIFETQFAAFLISLRENKWPFWNPKAKLNKIGMFVRQFWTLNFI